MKWEGTGPELTRVEWLGDEDSNLSSRVQSPLSYR